MLLPMDTSITGPRSFQSSFHFPLVTPIYFLVTWSTVFTRLYTCSLQAEANLPHMLAETLFLSQGLT